ncbi:MAG: hypothetical protein LYZ69_04300 [Nitrososphaerales archaeon]|nr:hypothetical protein [Nitrososphaerales archaeon]
MRKLDYRERFCSDSCRRKKATERHRKYTEANREHMREYEKSRRLRLWGASSPEKARKAEVLAFNTVLPKIGFAEIYDATRVRRFIPFDFAATYEGERVLIDVTTAISKSNQYHRSALSLADALRMRLYILFIKPDLAAYALKLGMRHPGPTCSPKELIPVG